MGGARFSQNGHLQRKATAEYSPESFAFNVLPSQQATFTPVFPGRLPRTAVKFDSDSHGDFVLPWDPVRMKEWGLRFPQSRGAPVHTSHWPSMPDAPGLFLPLPDPHTWGFDVGLRTFTPLGESL